MGEFTAIKFDTSDGAYDAFKYVRDNKAEHRPPVHLADLAVVEMHKTGRTTVHSPHGDTNDGLGWGAIAGAFAFLALPPLAGGLAWAGAIGLGGALGRAKERGSIPDGVVDELRGELTHGTSMLLLFAPAGFGQALADAVEPLGPVKVLRYELPDPVHEDFSEPVAYRHSQPGR